MIIKTLSECYVAIYTQSKKYFRTVGIRKYATLQETKPFKSIPGLSSLPYLGPLHHFMPIIGQFGPKASILSVAEVLYEKYGPTVRLGGIFGRADMVVLYDPQDIDQVYRSQESNPIRPIFQVMEHYREVVNKSELDGFHGLITTKGTKWRESRMKVNPALLEIKLVKVYAPALEEIAKDLTTRFNKLNGDQTYFKNNLYLEFEKWALESVGYVALGTRLGCLTDELDDDHFGSILMRSARNIFELTFELEFLPSPWKYIATPAYKRFMKECDAQYWYGV